MLLIFSIRRFLIRNGDVTGSDLRAIVKRLDINKDGRISYNEFRNMFTFPDYNGTTSLYRSRLSPYRSSSPIRSISPLRTNGFRSTSPLRCTSPLRTCSPLRTTSPIRSSLTKSPRYYSPRRIYSPYRNATRYISPLRSTNGLGKSTYRPADEMNIVEFSKDLIFLENELDRVKSDLALRSDFTVEDCYKIFEINGRGYITDLDLKYGLNSLGIFPSNEEIQLLFKRYDLSNRGVVSYADFFDMITPLDIEYKRIIESRRPSSELYPRSTRSDIFLPSTKSSLQKVLRLLISSEGKVESWRQRLERATGFRIKNAFDAIDRLEKSHFNESDLVTFLRRNDINYLTKDLDLLLARFDKNRDGIVGYSEVIYFLIIVL
jgi:Ca2+-binding EF-hand superfamily protein